MGIFVHVLQYIDYLVVNTHHYCCTVVSTKTALLINIELSIMHDLP